MLLQCAAYQKPFIDRTDNGAYQGSVALEKGGMEKLLEFNQQFFSSIGILSGQKDIGNQHLIT